jgi:Ca-activated chloride channel homolog
VFNRPLAGALLFNIVLACTASAQVLSFPFSNNVNGAMSMGAISTTRMDFNILNVNTQNPNSTLQENPRSALSKLDLKAPRKARREYDEGYRLLMAKNLQGSLAHLAQATAIYPSFVAAHIALGSAYLSLGQNEQARGEFTQAIALDDHLPNSYLNLGCAQLALKDYPAAEESLRRASSIAPLDLTFLTALAYGELVNHDYPAVLATAHQVHEGKHQGAAIVHYFAAGAWEAQGNLSEAQHEIEVLLKEDPNSPSAEQFRLTLEQIKLGEQAQAEAKLHPAAVQNYSLSAPTPTAAQVSRQAQQVLQDLGEKRQIAEAEAAPNPACVDCSPAGDVESAAVSSSVPVSGPPINNFPGPTLRASVDEVALFFTATDHGRSVMNLNSSDVEVRDDNRPPATILEFRNESQLPLRLGLVIDMSDSVTDRFTFEEAAATKFLQKVVTGQNDLAFVIGVNNSVLLVQDFTADQTLTARAINQLAPSGGTALWDAVAFASEKLGSRTEAQPVARVLVVISDGNDNSSSVTLKQAIAKAQHGEVAVYTVSTRDDLERSQQDFTGDHALRDLAELTGGAAFVPRSVSALNGSLAQLQQAIRGRYLLSYKPASFQRDGRYRAVDIKAQKDGHTLKVFARRGYYTAQSQSGPAER